MDVNAGVDALTLAAIQDHFNIVLAIDMDWPGDYVRAHSGVGDMTWDGNTYSGVGDFGEIDIPVDEIGVVPSQAMVTLIHTPDELINLSGQSIRNRDCTIYFGLTTEPAGNVLVGDLNAIYSGYMDFTVYTATSRGDEQVHKLSVTLGSGPGMRTARQVHHSYEDQTASYPSDTAGRILQQLLARSRITTWPE